MNKIVENDRNAHLAIGAHIGMAILKHHQRRRLQTGAASHRERRRHAAGDHHVTPGAVVYVNRNERHWHGAEPEFSMTHISINGPGETHVVE